jgi:hypothetical protein
MMHDMRTTLTLDKDVAAALDRLRKRGDAPYRDIVNDALRRGLQQIHQTREPQAPYSTPASDAGACLVGSLDNIAEVLAVAEGEDFKS